ETSFRRRPGSTPDVMGAVSFHPDARGASANILSVPFAAAWRIHDSFRVVPPSNAGRPAVPDHSRRDNPCNPGRSTCAHGGLDPRPGAALSGPQGPYPAELQ